MRHLRDNLLIQFSFTSLVVMASIAVVLTIVLSHKIEADSVADLVEETIGTSSQRLHRAITPADLVTPMTGERFEGFHRFVQDSIVSQRTARVKIFAADGTLIYSDDQAQIGERFPDKEGLITTLRGEQYTEVSVPDDADNRQERELGTLMEVYTPIVFPGSTEIVGAFEIYQFYAPTARRIDSLRHWLFGAIGVGFLVLYGGLVLIVGNGWQTIVGQRRRLEAFNSELENQVVERTSELKEAQARLVRSERLAAIGQLSAGVAHELRNPLGAIKNAAYYLRTKLQDSPMLRENPRIDQFLEIMDEEIQSSNQIITDLMDFARVNPPDLVPTGLTEVVQNALDRTELGDQVQVVNTVATDLPPVLADSEQLRRALSNLFRNAEDAMPGGGSLMVSATATDGLVELRVADTGEGIAPVDLGKIFDPLFTTKTRGIGLGLAIVGEIVRKHQGSISVDSQAGEGTCFTIKLPAAPEPALQGVA